MTEEGTFTTKIPKLPVTLVFYWVKAVTMQYGGHLPRQMTHALHKILLPKNPDKPKQQLELCWVLWRQRTMALVSY